MTIDSLHLQMTIDSLYLQMTIDSLYLQMTIDSIQKFHYQKNLQPHGAMAALPPT